MLTPRSVGLLLFCNTLCPMQNSSTVCDTFRKASMQKTESRTALPPRVPLITPDRTKRKFPDSCPNRHKAAKLARDIVPRTQLPKEKCVYPCSVACAKTFSTRQRCTKHERKVHLWQKHACLYCPKAYMEENCLMTHLAKKHPTATIQDRKKSRPFLCTQGCNATFIRREDCSRHERNDHTPGIPVRTAVEAFDMLSDPFISIAAKDLMMLRQRYST